MYVCLCNGVTDQDIKNWKEQHPQEPKERCLESLKIGSGCGICKREAGHCLAEDNRDRKKCSVKY